METADCEFLPELPTAQQFARNMAGWQNLVSSQMFGSLLFLVAVCCYMLLYDIASCSLSTT